MTCRDQTPTADADYVKIRYIEEDSWGQDPGSGDMQELRFTAESLRKIRSMAVHDRISDARQVKRISPTGFHTAGEINGRFSKGTYDDLIRGALGGTWDDTCVSSCSGCFASVVDGNLRYADSCRPAIDRLVGRVIRFDETFAADGNNRAVLVLGADDDHPDHYIVYPRLPADEGEGQGGGNDAEGKYIENDREQTSFYIEKEFIDLESGEDILSYSGMVVDQMSVNVRAAAVPTISFSFLGKRESIRSQPLLSGRIEKTATDVMGPGARGKTYISWQSTDDSGDTVTSGLDGLAVRSVSLDVKNNLQVKNCVGVLNPTAIRSGRFSVTGSMSIYFQDFGLYRKFHELRENDPFSMMFTAGDLDSEDHGCYCFYAPATYMTTSKITAGGVNRDVMVDIGYQAAVDGLHEKTLIISRV